MKKTLEKAAKIFGKKSLKDLSLVLVGDSQIKKLNRIYRKKNCVTDVLSFEGLNEIFICLPQAERQAKKLKKSLKNELTRLLAHGIVHLQGFDHKTKAETEIMKSWEEKILK